MFLRKKKFFIVLALFLLLALSSPTSFPFDNFLLAILADPFFF